MNLSYLVIIIPVLEKQGEQPGDVVTEEEGDNSAFDSQHWGPERTIVLNRQPNQGLGISIVGGKVNPVGSGKESSGKVATENIH